MKFTIIHDALSERYFPEECYEFRIWQGDGYGEIVDVKWLAGIMSIDRKIISGCENLEESPGFEETTVAYFEWWVLGKLVVEKKLSLLVCTCNSAGFPYGEQLVDGFFDHSTCPSCVPGIMNCAITNE